MAKFNAFVLMGLITQVSEVINEDDNYTPDGEEVSAMLDILVSGMKGSGYKVSPEAQTAVDAVKMLSGTMLPSKSGDDDDEEGD